MIMFLESRNIDEKSSSRNRLSSEYMIGHKLGEFIFTKKLGSSIHDSEDNAKRREKLRRKITQKKIRKAPTTKKSSKYISLLYFHLIQTSFKEDRKSTRLNSSHSGESRMPSSA